MSPYYPLDLSLSAFQGQPSVVRRLSDLKYCFVDQAAYEADVLRDDAVVYSISVVEPGQGEGQLHIGLGVLMPGRVGAEYYMTRGHLHTWRSAAEVYYGLSGEGLMLLEGENGAEPASVPLRPNSVTYVPGHTAHRTVNIGDTPLTYLAVYPAQAGHDYFVSPETNFQLVVIESGGQPQVLNRSALVANGKLT
jgi:glucose-6-phosphate isomerase